jgi:hypothetical protein
VNRSQKVFKSIVAAVILIAGAGLVIDNFHFDPESALVLRRDVELSWETPTENSDSTPLVDLAGYSIHCWNAESRQAETLIIEDPRMTSYRIDRLRPGAYQCAMSTVTGTGSESTLSNVVTRTVP